MKIKFHCLIIVTLFICQYSHGLSVKWESTIPSSNFAYYDSQTGADGSAAVITYDNTIYWYSSTGHLQSTIDIATETGLSNYSGSPAIVSNTYLILSEGEIGTRLIVFSLTDEAISHEVITGFAHFGNSLDLPASPYLPIFNGTTLTMYELPDLYETVYNPEITMVPNNAVVIPSSYQGNVEVMLETSNDLVEWVQALPGTYNSETSPRFFRVRAESAK